MLEDLLNTTIVLGKDSCQYRYRQCVVCDYLEYEIEDHKHGDDWDIRDYYEFYRIETGKWHIVPTEPYYVYIISLDLVPGSGDRLGNLDKCSRVKSCTNRGRDWTCPRFFDEPEPHVFKLYHECEKWEIYYGKERQHLFSNNGEKGGIYDSLSEIGNFEEIVIWLNDSNSMVSCKAGWCIRCGVSGSRAALTPQINKWHEWEGMCRRTIICIDNSQYDTTNFTFISIDTCNEILYEETKPHNVVGNTCIDCGYTVNGDTCTDFDCTDPHCPEHGNSSNNRCYFCGDNERCSLCNTCVNCDNCSHCTDCGARIWHNFEQYDPEIGYHWSIVPELIGDGTWDDIIEWLTNTQNFINCFGTKCSSCTTGQGKKITPIIKDWHERVYSDGFSACYRAIVCSECGDDVIAEAKVHNFKDDKCEDCGALKDGTNGNGGADIIITPSFTDSNFLADVRLLVGKTSDDEVYLSDVSKIQNYRAVTPGIQNFAGIEHFEDLTHFAYYAQWNIVESLDVTQNLKLQNLDIQRQRLTSLDLSKNSELINLNCRANNITAISLPTDSKLKELIINNNPLGSIDISKQKQLEHLQINTSQLTTLDLSSQERLIHLSATGNRLTSVDLSKNTELLSVSLQNNELTGLNVTNNKKITILTIDRNNICTIDLSQNILLSRFYAHQNGMTSLDISNNTELREVHVSNNQLNTLDVSNNIKLNSLIASGNILTELNLSNNLQLVDLRVGTNQISNLDVSMLTQLEILSVIINNLTALNLISNTKLVDLYCDRNNLTQLDLSKNVMLRALDFSHNNLISIDLSNNPLLNYLRCGGNRLPNVNAVTLPSGVVWNDRIQFGTQKP
jgi:Leucine-rich repeat (LRR) protein